MAQSLVTHPGTDYNERKKARSQSDCRKRCILDAGQTGMDAGHTGLRDTADPACRRKGRTVWPLDFVRIRSLSVRAPELVEAFRGIPSSNIGDCTQRMNCMFDGIRPFNDLPLVGTAFTVRVPSGDNLVAQAALDYARPGDIIVIDAAGNTDRGMVGGMMLAYAEMRGWAALW